MSQGILTMFLITLLLSAVGGKRAVPLEGLLMTGAGGAHGGISSGPIQLPDQELLRLQKEFRRNRRKHRAEIEQSAPEVIALEEAVVK